MKFATFAKQIFHSEAISLGEAKFHSPQANFVEKSTHLSGRQMSAFFWRRVWDSEPAFRPAFLFFFTSHVRNALKILHMQNFRGSNR